MPGASPAASVERAARSRVSASARPRSRAARKSARAAVWSAGDLARVRRARPRQKAIAGLVGSRASRVSNSRSAVRTRLGLTGWVTTAFAARSRRPGVAATTAYGSGSVAVGDRVLEAADGPPGAAPVRAGAPEVGGRASAWR